MKLIDSVSYAYYLNYSKCVEFYPYTLPLPYECAYLHMHLHRVLPGMSIYKMTLVECLSDVKWCIGFIIERNYETD
jgi:hypothetical protein